MAIDTQCPHCSKAYRLKDDLAGKRVTCGNPNCRKAFTVGGEPANGAPVAKPRAKATVPPVDADALAASLFAEGAAEAVPEDKRVIAVTCPMCDHKWDVPYAMQGKNVLCPECRHRVKIPEQKAGKVDWRDPNAGGPSLRKIEKLEGAEGTVDARMVSGKALQEGGVFEDDTEPRPRWHYVAAGLAAVVVVAGIAFGAYSIFKGGKEGKQNRYMEDALAEATEPRDTQLTPAEAPLFRAGILMAAGEYAVRQDEPKKLKEALDSFAKARQEIDAAPASPDRELMFGELASALILLGGDDGQVEKQTRVRWTPAPARDARARSEGKVYNVQELLVDLFKQMRNEPKPVPQAVRLLIARRVTRELAARGQPALMGPLLSQGFPDELPEAKAAVAAEAFKATGDLAKAKEAAAELVSLVPSGTPPPPTASALWAALDTPPPGAPKLDPPPAGPIEYSKRLAHVTALMLQNKAGEALDLAKRPGNMAPESHLQALALVAEWGDPGQAVQAAAEFAPSAKSTMADLALVRLAQQAGRVNQQDKVEVFLKAIQKEEYRAWARYEALRAQFAAGGDKPADSAAAPIPENAKDQKVGHALARLAVYRNNARATGDAKPSLTEIETLGLGTFRPYGRAGLALGLQDRVAR